MNPRRIKNVKWRKGWRRIERPTYKNMQISKETGSNIQILVNIYKLPDNPSKILCFGHEADRIIKELH